MMRKRDFPKSWGLGRRLVVVAIFGVVVWVLILFTFIPLIYYFSPPSHRTTISLDHLRQVLVNLSEANISRLYIRHDIDGCSSRLYRVLALEAEEGFNSTICIYPVRNLIFYRWFVHSRMHFDWDVLQFYCMSGWVVSYHLNAYERAGYDPVKGDRLAMRDVRWVEENLGFEVDRFSVHGGYDGIYNGSVVNNYVFAERFADLSGLKEDDQRGYDYFFWDVGGVPFSVPKEISGSVYLLIHPEWYG